MSRKLYIKAKSTKEGEEINAIEIYLYHSKERKDVQVVVQEAKLRREDGYTSCTTMMFGGVRAKVADMPRFSQSKFDAILLDDLFMKALVNKLIEESKGTLELELDENGGWVIL